MGESSGTPELSRWAREHCKELFTLFPIIHLVRQINVLGAENGVLTLFSLFFVALQRTNSIFAEWKIRSALL
jgi:hypothetical protein